MTSGTTETRPAASSHGWELKKLKEGVNDSGLISVNIAGIIARSTAVSMKIPLIGDVLLLRFSKV
ncbi:hypothetical protein SR914_21890 [Comamonas testosteroni]|uniref:hypothetical protein n=1 Tax=Comamonas testosteroni TaxID=285 RepID=UPI001237452F|nr:hypothetical protein [Comamonas testosteroni]WQG65795.1 hypothetical protein SR914_21890 [Comamonas testosteroni]